ncbi:MXAN_2562 family outer membrane beta-barrel protein [Myxococcota bacterium]
MRWRRAFRGLQIGVPSLCGLTIGLMYGSRALAQGTDEFGAYGGLEDRHRLGSRQDMALELRFGPYLPNVDGEAGLTGTPYRTVFGDDNRYLLGFEVDYQAIRVAHLGSLGAGIGWGYTYATGQAFHPDGGRSGDETGLSLMPFYLVAVFRADVLARETLVPVAFYAKAGLGYALWWSSSGEETSREAGVAGRGSSLGYQGALGGMLHLNPFDRAAAVEMDNATGINSSYVFLEWYLSSLDGLGSGMQVGTNTWMLGLTFEI